MSSRSGSSFQAPAIARRAAFLVWTVGWLTLNHCCMAILRKRHSPLINRPGMPSDATAPMTSLSGSRRYAAASASVSTSPVGPLKAVGSISDRRTGCDFFFVRGMAHVSFYLGRFATLPEIFLVGYQLATSSIVRSDLLLATTLVCVTMQRRWVVPLP